MQTMAPRENTNDPRLRMSAAIGGDRRLIRADPGSWDAVVLDEIEREVNLAARRRGGAPPARPAHRIKLGCEVEPGGDHRGVDLLNESRLIGRAHSQRKLAVDQIDKVGADVPLSNPERQIEAQRLPNHVLDVEDAL